MRRTDLLQYNLFSVGESHRPIRFWTLSFTVYALAEAFYLLLNFSTMRNICSTCLAPPIFFGLLWFFSLIFTTVLWYCLNLFYYRPLFVQVLVNVLLFVVQYFGWIGVLYSLRHSGWEWLTGPGAQPPSFTTLVYSSWFDIGKYVLKLSAFYVLKFYFEYRRSEQQRIELAVLNKDLQLNLLKQQLSPHFYFNTLNNLYGLARSNSPKLTGALHQLSNIMQYVIVDCNQPKVLLSQEVNFLQSYIALEKLRYEQNTLIEMQVDGHANGQNIPPLLLIQFVENAFKHGMKEKSEQNWMRVRMNIDGGQLFFSVDNSYNEASFTGGIGIASVKHRLNLLYEGKYDMQMKQEGKQFSISLKLNLS